MRHRALCGLLAAAVLVWTSAYVHATAEESPAARFVSSGPVKSINVVDQRISFSLEFTDETFVVTAKDIESSVIIFDALKDAQKTGQAMAVGYDPATGRLDPLHSTPIFDVDALTYEGVPISGVFAPSPPTRPEPSDPRGRAEAALIRGAALGQNGDIPAALLALHEALAGHELIGRWRAYAYRSKANAELHKARELDDAMVDDRDKALVDALLDFQDSAAADSDEMSSMFQVANTLTELGAYQDAIDVFEDIQRRWPDEGRNIATGLIISYRGLGNNAKALEVQDAMTAKYGRQDGMRFHYHRGWTLENLGRYDEAVAELTEGLKSQPDYVWAFMRRTCAFTRLGRLQDALSDQQRALDLWRRQDSTLPPSVDRARAIKWSESVIGDLESAISKASHDRVDSPCTGYFDKGLSRSRSSVLPPNWKTLHASS